MYRFKVMELYSLGSCQLSYGILASVLENDVCTCAAYIPDIYCNRAFAEELALRCNEEQLNPMHLLDVVWMRCPDVFSQRGRAFGRALSPLLLLHLTLTRERLYIRPIQKA